MEIGISEMNNIGESSQKSDHETKLKKRGHKVQKCHPCGKSFTRSGSLKTHKNTVHEGHKKYKCESCGRSFSQRANLKVHELTHLRDLKKPIKDQKCETCDKIFSLWVKVCIF